MKEQQKARIEEAMEFLKTHRPISEDGVVLVQPYGETECNSTVKAIKKNPKKGYSASLRWGWEMISDAKIISLAEHDAWLKERLNKQQEVK